MQIDIPELSLVTLIGASEGEKSVFFKANFNASEVLTFDYFKDLIEDESEQITQEDILNALYDVAGKRLRDAKLTVIDADNTQEKERKRVVTLAKKHHCFPVAIVFNDLLSIEEKAHKISSLEKEGFRYVYVFTGEEEARQAEVLRTKLYNNKRDIHGPFDIIGDVHGCYDELCELLEKLGYVVDRDKYSAYSPEGRIAAFTGDLVDRGPKSAAVLRLVMSMIKEGTAYCTLGNHDGKLQRKLKGANVKIAHGLEITLEELSHEPEAFVEEVKQFLDKLISHYVFDDGKLVVAHAGLKEKLHGRGSKNIRNLAMFGETTGKVDKLGLPIRLNWAKGYHGKAFVVYGHTPRESVKIMNNTANIDTGCVFGGKLTALRYPEKEIVDVKVKAVYYEPSRPLLK
ncbi:metallophosphoesterase [Cellulosilyticum sp. I15G10I2]|uniref:metallophosphoesterase n=1 Tax=Cellulosilyticum sp. I15G10I2 TaxID=1892843 RepID=UPI00085BC611|nr:metallophosphoesterase [Cellulosilyticum sp. I15G10I2]